MNNLYKIFAIIALIIIKIILIILDIVDLNATEKYKLSDCFNFILVLSPRVIIFPFLDTIPYIYNINITKIKILN